MYLHIVISVSYKELFRYHYQSNRFAEICGCHPPIKVSEIPRPQQGTGSTVRGADSELSIKLTLCNQCITQALSHYCAIVTNLRLLERRSQSS